MKSTTDHILDRQKSWPESDVSSFLFSDDKNKDGLLDINDFLRFYQVAASGNNIKAVQSNLKNHNVRLDLKKMADVVDELDYDEKEMPRYTLSANQEQF